MSTDTQILSNLPVDRVYKLEEMTPPPGFVKLISEIYFKIYIEKNNDSGEYEENVILCDVNGDPISYGSNVTITKGTGTDPTFKITVQNTPGASLPSTGGAGTTLLYALGILLMGLAAAGLVMDQKRRLARR